MVLCMNLFTFILFKIEYKYSYRTLWGSPCSFGLWTHDLMEEDGASQKKPSTHIWPF